MTRFKGTEWQDLKERNDKKLKDWNDEKDLQDMSDGFVPGKKRKG